MPIDPENNIQDAIIVDIIEHGIEACCYSIGKAKILKSVQEEFEREGRLVSKKDHSLIIYGASPLNPVAKINVDNENINFEWSNNLRKTNPLYIIGTTLRTFYKNFGELDEAIRELNEDGIIVASIGGDSSSN